MRNPRPFKLVRLPAARLVRSLVLLPLCIVIGLFGALMLQCPDPWKKS